DRVVGVHYDSGEVSHGVVFGPGLRRISLHRQSHLAKKSYESEVYTATYCSRHSARSSSGQFACRAGRGGGLDGTAQVVVRVEGAQLREAGPRRRGERSTASSDAPGGAGGEVLPESLLRHSPTGAADRAAVSFPTA